MPRCEQSVPACPWVKPPLFSGLKVKSQEIPVVSLTFLTIHSPRGQLQILQKARESKQDTHPLSS